MNAEAIAKTLGGARSDGGGWWGCCCPAHDDERPSLRVRDADNGGVAYKCMAGCGSAAVTEALRARGLLPERKPRKNADKPERRLVGTYGYLDAASRLVLEVCRFEPKDFRQRRPDGQGGWDWKIGNIVRPLYRLPELLAAGIAEPVFLVEGEKDADRLRSLDLIATTTAQGAKGWAKSDPAPLFGRHVVLLPDNDEAGQGYAAQAARDLAGKAASLRLVILPGLPPKGDVSDWLDAGGTADQLRALADAAPPYAPPAEPEAPKVAGGARAGAEPWKDSLHRRDGEVRDILHNAAVVLREHPQLFGRVRCNRFSGIVEARDLPWRDWEEGKWDAWTDADDLQLAAFCQRRSAYLRPNTCAGAVQVVAHDHEFHPVRERLKGLTWDHRVRLGNWLAAYLGAGDDAYARAVGRKWLISGVARVMEPGCKADHCLILEGAQGAGKSTAAATLALEDAWFSDEIADLGTKDAAQDLRGKWSVELGELSALNRGATERVKAFMSRRVDHYRPSYGKRSQDFPRQCVFIGSTNADVYLADETGARRFWPVKVGTIDIAKLKADREQLWAEAVAACRAGETWWLDKEAEQQARRQQEERRIVDPWDELVLDWAEGRTGDGVTIKDAMTHALELDYDRRDQQSQNRIARIFRAAGWTRRRDTDAGRAWRYHPPAATAEPAPDQADASRSADAFARAGMRSVPDSSHAVPVGAAPIGTDKPLHAKPRPGVPVRPSGFPVHRDDDAGALGGNGPGGGESDIIIMKTPGQTGTTGTAPPAWDDLNHWQAELSRTQADLAGRKRVALRWALAAGGTRDGYGMVELPPLRASYAGSELRRVLLDTGLVRHVPPGAMLGEPGSVATVQ